VEVHVCVMCLSIFPNKKTFKKKENFSATSIHKPKFKHEGDTLPSSVQSNEKIKNMHFVLYLAFIS